MGGSFEGDYTMKLKEIKIMSFLIRALSIVPPWEEVRSGFIRRITKRIKPANKLIYAYDLSAGRSSVELTPECWRPQHMGVNQIAVGRLHKRNECINLPSHIDPVGRWVGRI